MSVSLSEVLTAAGYDIKNNIEDARWFLSRVSEFEELQEDAEDFNDDYEEYEDFVDLQEDMGNFDNPTFEEWRAGHERN
ncbi:MAG: hypothetical protein IIZ78_00680 [Clostridiales bacterium]|nr:hypothetical protein [Clostridiales bacterium]